MENNLGVVEHVLGGIFDLRYSHFRALYGIFGMGVMEYDFGFVIDESVV